MTMAETAHLAVELKLTGNFTKDIASANAAISKAEGTTARAAGGFAVASRAATSFGGALGHAKGQLQGLITGPLGIIGLTSGLFSFGGIIESSLRHTSDFGLAIEKMTGLTGESAQSVGELLLVFEKYGITAQRTAQLAGFAEKTIGKLNETTAAGAKGQVSVGTAQDKVRVATEKLRVAQLKLLETEHKRKLSGSQLAAAENRVTDATHNLAKAQAELAGAHGKTQATQTKLQALDAKYGLQLVDNKGKVVDYTTELRQVAGYYTSNASASDKAYLAATLFGRGYADLIPILSLGTKGFDDARQAVADMGLSLGTDTQGALSAYKSSLRQVGEAIGILQTEIGLALIPTVVKLANGFTLFLEHGGTKSIAGFFQTAGEAAGKFVDVMANQVIPTLAGMASAAKSAWDSIPPPLRDLLAKGFIADRTIKFLFGFSPVGAAASGLGGALSKGLLGGLLARGSSPANPLFVADVGGLGGGRFGPPVPKGLFGGGGLFGIGAAGLGAIAISAIAPAVLAELAIAVAGGPQGVAQRDYQGRVATNIARGGTGAGVPYARPGTPGGEDFKSTAAYAGTNATAGEEPAWKRGIAAMTGTANHAGKALDDLAKASGSAASAARAVHGAWFGLAHMSLKDVIAGIQKRSAAKYGGTGLGESAVDATFRRDLIRDTARIAKSTETGEQKLKDLKALQALAISHKDYGVAAKIGARIDATKARLAATTAATTQAIRDKRMSVVLHNMTVVDARISVRDTLGSFTTYSRYSSSASSSASPGK